MRDQIRTLGFLEEHFPGLTFVRSDPKITEHVDETYWGGGRICLTMDGRYQSFRTAMHEFAHWLVAPKSRKNKPNFGLGLPVTMEAPSQLISEKARYAEEQMASALGIHILWIMGYRDEAKYDFKDHSWDMAARGRNDMSFLSALKKALSRLQHDHRLSLLKVSRVERMTPR